MGDSLGSVELRFAPFDFSLGVETGKCPSECLRLLPMDTRSDGLVERHSIAMWVTGLPEAKGRGEFLSPF